MSPRRDGPPRDRERPRDRSHDRDRARVELGEQVEGRHAVLELLTTRRRKVYEVWLVGDDEVAELATGAGARVHVVTPDELTRRARTEVPQGVVARAAPLPVAELDALLETPAAFLLALDGVTDPQNLGAVLRTAETAGVTGVLIPRHRAVALTPAVAKAAAGALEHLAIAFVGGIPAALDRAARAGVWRVGLDSGGHSSLYDLAVADQALVLVLGAEGRGLSRLARERCDIVASIPMRGHIESLNVSAAAAVACYEIARRRATDGVEGAPADRR